VIPVLALLASFGPPSLMCRLSDEAVSESSGLAASTERDGVFYTHNDSGDSARFFRFDRTGKVTGIFTLRGAEAVDWEDMASAKVQGRGYLYLGDVGDNAQKRPFVTVYRVPEPSGPGGEIAQVERYDIRYPDKPRDCEAIFVEPERGHIWLISKARDKTTVVYRVLRPARPGAFVAERLGEIPVATGGLGGDLVTGGDASPQGDLVALRTYTGILIYEVEGAFEDWWKKEPKQFAAPVERQGEAICFTRRRFGLLTSSEGSPAPISILRRQD
jgi:hypothetical protein